MKNFIFFVLVFISAHTFAQPNPKYTITASLNDRNKTLDGFLQLEFTNSSPDTIGYLWFNVYPNAFKSDRTALSEYLLDKGRTDFYFAEQDKRGYINRLDFRSGVNILKTEDHPLYIDIIKVILDRPLPPGKAVTITTPFHVKLPYDFDGIGYKYPQYNLKYWYPAVAEYVKPLTDPDSSSNMNGDYEVELKVPAKFSVDVKEKKVFLLDSVKTLSYSENNLKYFSIQITKPHLPTKIQVSDPHKYSQKIKNILAHPILPAIGYNEYDGFQLGLFAHGDILQSFHPNKNISYFVAPLYTFRSKSVAGIAGASYLAYPKKYIKEFQLGVNVSTFSLSDGVDTSSNKVFGKLFKVVPFVKVKFPTRSPKIEKSVTFKSYIINEKDLEFVKYSVDSLFYPAEGEYATRFVNELTFDYSSKRVLYPYHAQLQVQQGITWYRVNATGNYFFNYPKGGGMNVRVFAAKFGYIGNLSTSEKFATYRYQPKLTAVRGDEDFTYSNYFVGRNSFDGLSSQQIMMRDGGLKLRTDLFEGLQGRTDNWLAAVNFNTTIPKIFPVNIPLRIFLDAGTYSDAWEAENPNPRFLYVAGLQLSLFKDLINIYAPVLYSKEFRDRLKSVPEENSFGKRISFSIDIQRLNPRDMRIK